MMRMRTKTTGMSPVNGITGSGVGGSEVADWELRPGGMLVQKRNPDSDGGAIPAHTIRVRVKHGSNYHEIYINSQASFGELKKLLAAPTGLHPQDQKLFFKDKERDSKAYLDIVGVKDRSKIVLVEDPTSQERRYLEMRKNAKMEKAAKSISEISLEVDKLAGQVSAIESLISRGGKVAETEVLNLIELLMNQLLKLDGIIADGDVKLQRRMQVRRVQKYVETLDLLKIRNAMPNANGAQMPIQQQQRHSTGQMSTLQQQQQQKHSTGQMLSMIQQEKQQPQREWDLLGQISPVQQQQQKPQPARLSAAGPVVVTTQWETFDLVPVPSTSTTTTTTTTTSQNPPPKFNWELF